jgi:outer membrane protein assembly factor BamA
VISAHRDGYSVSLERGVAAGVTAELVRRALGSSADATTVSADLRAYVPGAVRHQVLAIRLAGGVTTGDRDLGRTFLLGGPGPNDGLLDFGSDAISLLRGFESDTFAGTRVGLVNVEYRVPLLRPQQGLGTWPFFLHTIHAAVFADAGHAWTRVFAGRDIKTSFGAELSEDVVLGYRMPLTVTVGLARGHDGSHAVADRTTFYVRVGRVF